jgi:hypothetical protein
MDVNDCNIVGGNEKSGLVWLFLGHACSFMIYGSKRRKSVESVRVVIFHYRFWIGCDA